MPTSRCEARERGGEGGFTLLELLATLAVAMLLLSAAPGLIGGGGAGGLDAASGMVASELRLARERALTQGRETGVAFDPEARRILPDDAPAFDLPPGVEIGLTTAQEARDALGAPGVLFFPEGGATGGVIALRRGEAIAEIEVRWLTGAVRVR